MQVDTNIQFTSEERQLFSIIKDVIEKYTPSTKAFLVGGIVRDKLLKVTSNDIDIMLSNISGADFAKLLTQHLNLKDPHIIKENPEKSKFITTATANIPIGDSVYEVDFAQARSEIYHEDSRIPEIKPATPQEDAYRRDLTINSLFYDILKDNLVDFTGKGIKDLITGTMRTPEDPLKTFKDDPLRIFRVIRFASKYNGKIDPETYQAMTDPSLRNEIKQKVSKERIGTEITKMLKNPNPEQAIELLKNTGLWQDIITEALMGTKYEGKMAGLEMEQNNPHHLLDTWGHTMQVVKNVLDRYPEADPEKRATMILAALMHDVGKLYHEIQVPSKSYDGRTSYIGHEKESREIAEHILKYLKMEPFIQQVGGMARYHMRPHIFTEQGVGGIRAMRKFIRLMGEKSLNWLDILNLAIADAYSKGVEIDPETIQKYQDLETKLQEALESMGPIQENIIPPVLNGNEVMQILNIKGGPHMSEIMEFVRELKDENPNITKDEAAERLRQQYGEMNKEAQSKKEKEPKEPACVCPDHLFQQRKKELEELKAEKKHYEITTILNDLKKEYGNDPKVLRTVASYMFTLLLDSEKYRNNDILKYVFNKSEKEFFDYNVCPFTVGMLLLIDTNTEDKTIETMANRMIKMNPKLMKSVIERLPENIERPKLRKKLQRQLK